MLLRKIIGITLIAGTTLYSASCLNRGTTNSWHNRSELLEELMLDKPQKELDRIKNDLSTGRVAYAETQHKIDSIAFSEIFRGSQQAKDSSFIADYNKMIAKTKTPLMGQFVDYKELNNKLADVLTVKEMKQIKNSPILPDNGGSGYFDTGKQYLVDSVYHHKLFEKYNLLNEKNMENFTKICKKVRP